MRVSVIMAVYNGAPYVGEAIRSILLQTYSDFEMIIVNDGSTDSTPEILSSFNDTRIKLLHQENRGCVHAMTRAINHARGKYLAIMDADDISLPKRLEKSIAFLDSHTDTVLVGTGYIIRNLATGNDETIIPPTEDDELRRLLLRVDPFKHPSIMMRNLALKKIGGYNNKIDHGFDYELYSRLAKIGKLANLQEVHLITRQHPTQYFRMGHTAEEHRKRRLKIRWLTLWRLRPPFYLFFRTLLWLFFEILVNLLPEGIRHTLPNNFRSLLKKIIPPNVYINDIKKQNILTDTSSRR